MCVVCVWDEGLGTLSSRPSKKPQGTSVKEIIIFYLLCCDGRLWFKFTIVRETMQHEAALLKVARGSRTSERTPTMPRQLIPHVSGLRSFRNKRMDKNSSSLSISKREIQSLNTAACVLYGFQRDVIGDQRYNKML